MLHIQYSRCILFIKSSAYQKLLHSRAFHTCSDLLGDLVILPLYPTDQKSKIAAKYTASDGGSKSAQLAHVPDRKQASQADSEPPYEEVY